MSFSMAEAAKQLGVSVSLIRRYEREFGLQFARTEQGRCELTEQDLTNLRIIRAYRQQNLPFDEIKSLLNRSALVTADTETAGPDMREVLAAIIARQDELEKVVQSQMTALQNLAAENQQLTTLNQRMQLLLEAPRSSETDALQSRVSELEDRAKASEEALDAATKDEMIRKLQRRLLDLEAAFATEISDRHEDEDAGILDELARAIQEQAATRPARKWWQLWR